MVEKSRELSPVPVEDLPPDLVHNRDLRLLVPLRRQADSGMIIY